MPIFGVLILTFLGISRLPRRFFRRFIFLILLVSPMSLSCENSISVLFWLVIEWLYMILLATGSKDIKLLSLPFLGLMTPGLNEPFDILSVCNLEVRMENDRNLYGFFFLKLRIFTSEYLLIGLDLHKISVILLSEN